MRVPGKPPEHGDTRAQTAADDLANRYRNLLRAIRAIPILAGFCYTQFTDTYQETNGLLLRTGHQSVPLEAIAQATSRSANAGRLPTRMGVARTAHGETTHASIWFHRKIIALAMTLNKRLFRSFWMAGFECSTQSNSAGVRSGYDWRRSNTIDVARKTTGGCASAGILAARDGVRWHLIDRNGSYDWSSWIPMLEAAREEKAYR